MLFLSLLLDMLLMLGGGGAFTVGDGAVGQVSPNEHRTHGHLPGPPNDHVGDNTTHIHHGVHGHTVSGFDTGGSHAAPPHHG